MAGFTGELSQMAIRRIYSEGATQAVLQPFLQVLDLRKVVANKEGVAPPKNDRYRLVISDGTNYHQAMLASQLNTLVVSGQLQKEAVLLLKQYIPNTVNNKQIVIILEAEVVSPPIPKVGNPLSLDGSAPKPHQNPLAAAAAAVASRPQPHTVPGNASVHAPAPAAVAQVQRQEPMQVSPVVQRPPLPSSWNKSAGAGPIAKTEGFGLGPGAAGMGASQASRFHPIKSLNPYQNKWIMKGRVTYKSDMKVYQNARGEGRLFSFEVTDESGAIRCTSFKETADKFFAIIEMGGVYTVTRGNLKTANPKYNRTNSEFEMTLDHATSVERVQDDGSTPQISYTFKGIDSLEKIAVGSFIDVVGVVLSVSEVAELTARSTGKLLRKRTITIVDESKTSVPVTLWGDSAESTITSAEGNPVIALKGVKRGDFNGISLDGMMSSIYTVNPDNVPRADQLRAWFAQAGGTNGLGSVSSLAGGGGGGGGGARSSERKTLSEAKEEIENGGMLSDKPYYFTSRVILKFVKKDGPLWYAACPETKKKMVEIAPGRWRCDATDKEYDHCDYRFIANVNITDSTDSLWLTLFADQGNQVFGMDAKAMNAMKEENEMQYDWVIQNTLLNSYVMRIKAKGEEYNGETKTRWSAFSVEPVDAVAESKLLLEEISGYN